MSDVLGPTLPGRSKATGYREDKLPEESAGCACVDQEQASLHAHRHLNLRRGSAGSSKAEENAFAAFLQVIDRKKSKVSPQFLVTSAKKTDSWEGSNVGNRT